MFNRVKQVYAALTAKITEEDIRFVEQKLNTKEQALFWGMNLPDQRHALNVAYTALSLAQKRFDVDLTLLTKCALLHDVGKVRGDVSTADKILTVLLHKVLGSHAVGWGRFGKGTMLANIRHAVYIYFNHPQRSAGLLQAIGEPQVLVDVVSQHHKAPAKDDSPELIILRMADNLN